jgi:heme exporter protein C
LLFLYLGFIALGNAFEDRRTGNQASAILAIVGLVNIPLIHYSVQWWNTLHQGSTVTRLGSPTIEFEMLLPLLIMFVAINFYFAAVTLNRTRCELLDQERLTQWVREIVNG